MRDPYKHNDQVVSNEKAKEILYKHKIAVSEEEEGHAIGIGLHLGYLGLKKILEANDFAHGPFETYMLACNGIIVDQPNPLESYTVYHVVEIEGTIEPNE